jgi:imidazolonepropionase-like amidohydrolase
MARIHFKNVRIIDGSGGVSFDGEVLVKGNRIEQVVRDQVALAPGEVKVVDGGGATLMPGLVEAHAHVSFTDFHSLEEVAAMPIEENLIAAICNAKLLLDQGFTSLFSAAATKPRLDVALRDAIDAGTLPGPRMRAATQEMTPSGNLGDLDMTHFPRPPSARFAVLCDSVDEFRRACRIAARESVDTFKVNVSGDRDWGHMGAGSEATVITDEELAAVVQVARARGKTVAAHATSALSVKMCVAQGVEVIYHAPFCDEEALDLVESVKDRVFVAPAVGFPYNLLHAAERYGVTHSPEKRAALERELEGSSRSMTALHKRGVRVLPGGDYGIFCTPQGENARDLVLFTELYGFTPMEALVAATRHGGALMGRGEALGQIRPGFLADLLLVDGDPLADIAILQDQDRLLAIMKDGAFHKPPPAQRAAASASLG